MVEKTQCSSCLIISSTKPWVSLVLLLSFSFLSNAFDYKDALKKSVLYFEAQRSGRLPYNQRVRWRGILDLLMDWNRVKVDLVGGYYDAGDNVKFGLPMAFTVTMLSWSVIEYGEQIATSGEYEHVLEAVKWGTDYFIKAHTSPNVFWAEVGDGDTDHYCWQRPEDMTTSRQAYKIDENNPGSDLAGETAAALAAASMVFRKSNPHYSHLLLHHAQQLFEFGDKYRGAYDRSLEVVKRYYPSVTLWLYKATDNSDYFKYIINNSHEFGGTGWAITEFSWDVKYAGIQILASKLLMDGNHEYHTQTILEQYRSKAEHYLCSCLGGLLFIRKWNNMQYVSTSAFLLTVYSDYLKTQIKSLTAMGKCASIVTYKRSKGFIGCTQGYDDWYSRNKPNPNKVIGALVGGPDINDNFNDHHGNYAQTETCTYNTAPLVGIFAKLPARGGQKYIPIFIFCFFLGVTM
ncbi:hypothetical protein MKW92_017251 [Papaver armeniacum]|nr:hypothetical protein MKW92_017251 [Papaver armeniacum]